MTSAGTVPPPGSPSGDVLPSGSVPNQPLSPAPPDAVPYASWSSRVVAVLLDQALLSGVVWYFGGQVSPPTLWPLLWDVEGLPPWHTSLAAVVSVLLLLGLQGDTGWTPGKLVVGIAVVRDRDLRPAGFLRMLGRVVVHVADAFLLFIGYLRPLWHAERRTFADSALRTVVVRRRPESLSRWARVAVTAVAALACALGVGFSTMTWRSGGGTELIASAQCVPVVSADGVTAEPVRVEGERNWGFEQRLWRVRWAPEELAFVFRWHWTQPDEGTSPDQATLTATVSRTDGTGAVAGEALAGENDFMTESGGLGTVTADAEAVVSGPEVAALVEPGVPLRLTSTLVLDGAVVATCTVDGLEPDPAGSDLPS